MNERFFTQSATIENTKGLHARAAAKFVKICSSFDAEAQVKSGDTTVSGRSIMGLLMLAATKGTRLEIRTAGRDAEALIAALQELIRNKFNEET